MVRHGSWSLAPAFALFVTGPALAEDAIAAAPRHVVEQSLGASYNALGLQHVLGLRWSHPLTRSHAPVLADAHAAVGVSHALTPSHMRFTPWVELAPLSVLGLRAGVEPVAYFGSFGSLRSYEAYTSDFTNQNRDGRPVTATPGTAVRAFLAPTFRIRVGQIALTSTATMEWWRSDAHGPFFYEPWRDTLLRASGDRLLHVSTLLVRQVPLRRGGQLTYGVGHELTEVFAADTNRSQRIGLVLARRLASKTPGRDGPTLAVRVSYYLDHPHRKGQLAAVAGVSVERPR